MPRPFFGYRDTKNQHNFTLVSRTEFNNHLKMFRRLTLWGTDQGFKVLRPSVFDLWATPTFRTRDFGRKMENLCYNQPIQIRCRFLCFLGQGIDCNYLFWHKSITWSILGSRHRPRPFSDRSMILAENGKSVLQPTYSSKVPFPMFLPLGKESIATIYFGIKASDGCITSWVQKNIFFGY